MRTARVRGATFWNGGTFYGPPNANSLHLLNAYFTEHPEDAEDIVISIKGPSRGDKASLQATLDQCFRILDGKKHLDVFQCARVDPNTPIETTMGVLAGYVKEGKISGIGLSEPSAEAIRRAAAVHPIACVEVEFSLFALEMVNNGVAAACAELDIPIVAYSPLGRGFLVSGYLLLIPNQHANYRATNRPGRSSEQTSCQMATCARTSPEFNPAISSITCDLQTKSKELPKTRVARLARSRRLGSDTTMGSQASLRSFPSRAPRHHLELRRTARQ